MIQATSENMSQGSKSRFAKKSWQELKKDLMKEVETRPKETEKSVSDNSAMGDYQTKDRVAPLHETTEKMYTPNLSNQAQKFRFPDYSYSKS